MARILCIEDEAPLRRIIAAELRDAGHEVGEAADGREGLSRIVADRPDLVVCDINMPDMDGFTVLSTLRRDFPDFAEMPFIFLTALADRKDMIAGKQLGVDDYLTKPVDFDLLLASVESRLAQVARVKALFHNEKQRIEAERQAAEDRLSHLTNHDDLTGLMRREAFAVLPDTAADVVLAVEIDRLKTMDLTLGHDVVSTVVRAAAQRLDGLAAGLPGATLARVGYDCFAIALAAYTLDQAETFAELVRDRMAEPYAAGELRLFTTVSVGVAPAVGPDGERAAGVGALLAQAEAAAHAGTRDGGNVCRRYLPELSGRELERLRIESALRDGLAAGEFEVHFQPKVSFADRRPIGMEALVRWDSATLGRVSPAAFIPVAEETGLITDIGLFVLRESCRRLKGWLDAGAPAGLQVAVNISVHQVRRGGLEETVRAVLAETGLPPTALVLEITESALADDQAGFLETLHALRGLGVILSIDDFGTGYSSLSYLARLPTQELKIDQSFVRGLPETTGSRTIVEAIISMASNLGMKLVAEGVETEAQMDYLRAQGCQVGQGYLFSRPLPAAAFEAYLLAS